MILTRFHLRTLIMVDDATTTSVFQDGDATTSNDDCWMSG